MALTWVQRVIRWFAHRVDLVVIPISVGEGWAAQVTQDLKAAQNLDNLQRGVDAIRYDNRAAVRMEMLQTIKDCNSPGEG